GFEPALLGGGTQRARRQPGRAVRVGVEAGEMLPDDLFGGVAFDAFGARIPVADDAVRIEHEQRVIHDALDEQAEVSLAFPDRLLGSHAFADVARDLTEAGEAAAAFVHRLHVRGRPESAAVLAPPPVVALLPPGPCRLVQDLGGNSGCLIFGSKEAREMLA